MKKIVKKGMTIDELGEILGFVVERMVTKDDIADIRREMATKSDLASLRKELKSDIAGVRSELVTLHVQVNGIESELREMRQQRLTIRIADLEEKVFGKSRS